MYKTILVATDGSARASLAVEQAAGLARACGAQLAIVTVTEPHPAFDVAEVGWSVPAEIYLEMGRADAKMADRILREARVRAANDAAQLIHIAERVPYVGILEAAAQTGADLIVMASSNKSGIDRLLLGSQTAKILSLAELPVLVVKDGREA